jgi:hypothetical protein
MPEFATAEAVALKNLTAAGAVVAAGTRTGYVVVAAVTVAEEQVLAVVQVVVTPVIFDEVVGIVLLPLVSVVEVIVRFHPAALPVRSLADMGMVNVGVAPMVPEKEAAVADSLNEPAVTAPVTPGVSAKAAVEVKPDARSPPTISSVRSMPPLYRR